MMIYFNNPSFFSEKKPSTGGVQTNFSHENHSRNPSYFDDAQKQDVVFKCHCAAEAGYAIRKKIPLNRQFVHSRQENVADLCIYVVQQTEDALKGLVKNPGVLNEFLQASILVSNQGSTEIAVPIDRGAILVYVRYETDNSVRRVDGVIELHCAPSEETASQFRRLLQL